MPLLAAAVVLIAAAAVRQAVWSAGPLRFYHKAPYWEVSGEDKALAREIYDANPGLRRVSVAENSRTRAVVRFLFETEDPVDGGTRDTILSKARALMEAAAGDETRIGAQSPFTYWEIFFCSNAVDEIWRASLPADRRGADRYTDWEELTEYEELLTVEDVRSLLIYTQGHTGELSPTAAEAVKHHAKVFFLYGIL